MSGSIIQPEEHVLSTLEADGSRRWLFPRLAKGRLWWRRRVVGWGLILLFNLLPFVYINGNPAFQLDIVGWHFYLFGFTFLPTDTLLFALFMLIFLVGIFFVTAVFGRVWCGWACPQTVYMEFVFRPIQRLFTGKSGVGGKPKKGLPGWRYIAMYAVYLLICFHLSNIFLSYFVGSHNVFSWSLQAPWKHPGGFFLVSFVTGLMMFDFAFWREQLCIIGCPYGRFQSVLLDKQSFIVSYDPGRGEPRGKPRKQSRKQSQNQPHQQSALAASASAIALPQMTTSVGDCIDCTMCVQVCPTGIDIREGLQLECINCAQCIDACDAVMDKLKRPRGLIRYASQNAIEGARQRFLRPRVVIYPIILLVLSALFLLVLSTKGVMDVTVLRNKGMPYNTYEDGRVENVMNVKIVNRSQEVREYQLRVEPDKIQVSQSSSIIRLEPDETMTVTIHLYLNRQEFLGGLLQVFLIVEDDQGHVVRRPFRMLGPRGVPVNQVDVSESDAIDTQSVDETNLSASAKSNLDSVGIQGQPIQ